MSGIAPFRVALTFDVEFADRPTVPGVTARILDELRDAAIRGTFFVQGRWAEAELALARRIAMDGHVVGNHSHHHARMTLLTAAGIVRDVRAAEISIIAATGVSPRPWFRCPFGAGAATARVADRLASVGYVDVGWHVDGRDWAGGSAERLVGRLVRETLACGDGTVVLLHGWPAATPIALPAAIRRLADAGATFTRIDELPRVPGRRSASALLDLPPGGRAVAAGATVT